MRRLAEHRPWLDAGDVKDSCSLTSAKFYKGEGKQNMKLNNEGTTQANAKMSSDIAPQIERKRSCSNSPFPASGMYSYCASSLGVRSDF